MSFVLPGITVPAGTPVFLAEGHAIELQPLYSSIEQSTGHTRLRRVRTSSTRVVDVGLSLDELQMYAFDDWFENILLAGERPFSAYVRSQGPGMLWWHARWQEPYTADPRGNGIWRVTGKLVLSGIGSLVGPDTSALSVSFGVNLVGQAELQQSASLSVSFGVDLTAGAPLSVSFGVALLTPLPTFRLREAGGFRLREAGGKRQRESTYG
jgi:hypothetical protein